MGLPLVPEVDRKTLEEVQRFYLTYDDAEWSAGFCAVYLGRIKHDEETPEDVLNAVAYLVIEGRLLPRDTVRGVTFYSWVHRPKAPPPNDDEHAQLQFLDFDGPGGEGPSSVRPDQDGARSDL